MKTIPSKTQLHSMLDSAQPDRQRATTAQAVPTFESEIRETPDALRRLLTYWQSEGRQVAAACAADYRPIREVIFTGMGASLYAAYPAKYLLARHGIPARIEPASELFYSLLDTVRPESLVIAASQSGETIETNKVVAALEEHRCLIVVANTAASRMAASGRPLLNISAGQETRTSSKTYTNTLALFYLIAEQIAAPQTSLDDRQWNGLVDAVESTLAQAGGLADQMLSHWGPIDRLQIAARGPSLATALEAALILAENTNVVAQPVDGGNFRHGFNYMAGEGQNLLLLNSQSPTALLTAGIATELANLGSRVVVLSSANAPSDSAARSQQELHLPLCSVSPELAPICEILPLEMLTLRLAERQGRDPGKLPHKVTQEE